jgi:hypothetical protein
VLPNASDRVQIVAHLFKQHGVATRYSVTMLEVRVADSVWDEPQRVQNDLQAVVCLDELLSQLAYLRASEFH